MPHKEEGSTCSINKTQLQNTQTALMVVELRECPARPETQANTTSRINELSLEKNSCSVK